MGRELAGNRPARCAGYKTEPFLEFQVVHLVDDAVDFISEILALGQKLPVVIDASLDARNQPDLRIESQPPVAQLLELLEMVGREPRVVRDGNAVATHLQRASGGDIRILVAQAPCRGIAGLTKDFSPASLSARFRRSKPSRGI